MSESQVTDPPAEPTPTDPPAEPSGEQPPADPPPQPQRTGLWAGKFPDITALEQGVAELWRKLEMPPIAEGKPIVGEGGLAADHEAAEALYKRLEVMQGRKSQPAAPAEPKADPKPAPKVDPAAPPGIPEPAPADDPSAGLEGFEGILARAGFSNPAELNTTWQTDGQLKPEHYEAFKTKTGLDKKTINTYFALSFEVAKANAAAAHQTMVQAFGGPDAYDTVIDWSKAFYANKPAVREDINRRLASRDADVRAAAARQILIDYKEDTGTSGSRPLASGTAAPKAAGGPFTSYAEYEAADTRITNGTATAADLQRLKATDRATLQKLILSHNPME